MLWVCFIFLLNKDMSHEFSQTLRGRCFNRGLKLSGTCPKQEVLLSIQSV